MTDFPEMADVETLFRDYVAAHRQDGRVDPRAYLERLAGAERAELEALIAAYLRRAPGRSWDPDAYAGSPAERAVQRIQGAWRDWELAPEPEPWPELLPSLRQRARIKRSDLVRRLAEAIGWPGEAERVGRYYHQMETGQLPSEGVSDRVLEALGELVQTPAALLRAAGSAIGAGENPERVAERVVFARTAARNPAYAGDEGVVAGGAPPGDAEPIEAGPPARGEESPEAEPDELDRLFTGGPGQG